MNQEQYIIKRKLNIVELSETLGNISEACRHLGVSRRHYYDIKDAIKSDGIEGLLEKSRKKPRVGNRVAPEVENALLNYCLEYSTHGQTRASNELARRGINVSPGGVRSIWLRHSLEKKAQRLKRLEKWAAENTGIHADSQIHALEEAKLDKQEHGEIEAPHPGFVVGQDTYYVGYIKGIGKIYQQTGIDVYSNVGFAKLYTDKTAITAADFLNDKVLPFFDKYKLVPLKILTDRGREYCGSQENHPFQLFLYLNEIEHSKTRPRRPQSNGSTERLNQTVQNEFYALAFRKTLYTSIEEIQRDLDAFMASYNENRTNQGKNCKGRTPKETFEANIELYSQHVHQPLAKPEYLN
ncbi:MAG: IS481 family transposase [Pseudobacteriovorax sp.]|nr:IS481 family transposase [Gammaproteobacteria bacterium]NRA67035.1 IS481 family transposase [Pseudobacteriovorax sp.]